MNFPHHFFIDLITSALRRRSGAGSNPKRTANFIDCLKCYFGVKGPSAPACTFPFFFFLRRLFVIPVRRRYIDAQHEDVFYFFVILVAYRCQYGREILTRFLLQRVLRFSFSL